MSAFEKISQEYVLNHPNEFILSEHYEVSKGALEGEIGFVMVTTALLSFTDGNVVEGRDEFPVISKSSLYDQTTARKFARRDAIANYVDIVNSQSLRDKTFVDTLKIAYGRSFIDEFGDRSAFGWDDLTEVEQKLFIAQLRFILADRNESVKDAHTRFLNWASKNFVKSSLERAISMRGLFVLDGLRPTFDALCSTYGAHFHEIEEPYVLRTEAGAPVETLSDDETESAEENGDCAVEGSDIAAKARDRALRAALQIRAVEESRTDVPNMRTPLASQMSEEDWDLLLCGARFLCNDGDCVGEAFRRFSNFAMTELQVDSDRLKTTTLFLGRIYHEFVIVYRQLMNFAGIKGFVDAAPYGFRSDEEALSLDEGFATTGDASHDSDEDCSCTAIPTLTGGVVVEGRSGNTTITISPDGSVRISTVGSISVSANEGNG